MGLRGRGQPFTLSGLVLGAGRIRDFDPTADETLFFPRLRGG